MTRVEVLDVRANLRAGKAKPRPGLSQECDDNSPFPSCLKPLYQSEAWCTTIHMEMSLIYT